MRLKSLDIIGFKSFADKIKLSFGDGITAVVGPNGSGKSNISDAVRWVLGEQSTKTLRGSKMEDVVFNGTTKRKPQGYAEVTLNFDNKTRYLQFDGDSVSITRRYYRSGDSEYMINKASVRLKDIHQLFMDTGLGRDGYSIISQGKIGDIVSSRSEDRREIFEEAAGISKYRYRKTEAEKKLKQTEENLFRLKDILTELEDRVGPLEKQAEKAKAFLEYSNEKKILEISLSLYNFEKTSQTLREQDNKLAISSAQYETVENEIETLQIEIDKLYENTNKHLAKMDQLRRETVLLEETATKKESEASIQQNDIIHNNEIIERIKKEIELVSQTGESMDNEIAEKKEQILQKEINIDYCNQQFEKCSAEIDMLRDRFTSSTEKIEVYNKEITYYSKLISDAKVKYVTAVSSINEIKSRLEIVEKNLLNSTWQEEKYLLQLDEYKELKLETEEKIISLNNSLGGYNFKKEAKLVKSEEYKQELNRIFLDSGEKTRRIKILEDLEKNLDGFAHSVKIVMKESERQMLWGIHGPISRLINVSEQYAVAIEIALGAAIQNIVVGTEEDAKNAIKLLKKKDGGRATFLPLTAIKGKPLNENGLEDCYGFVGIASQLVAFDVKYKSIIDQLLGRVVVADALDSAVAIAKKYSYRFRIVTLDGQVVNAGGSLTGGSLAKNAGLLSRQKNIQSLKQEALKLDEQLKQISESKGLIQKELLTLEATITALNAEISVEQEDKLRFDGEIKTTQNGISVLISNKKELAKEKETLKFRLKELNEIADRSSKEEKTNQSKLSEIENSLELVSGNRADLTEKREILSSRFSEIRLEIMSEQKDIDLFYKAIEEINQRKEGQSKRIESLENEIKTFKSTSIIVQVSIKNLIAESETLREKAQKTNEFIITMQSEREGFEQKTTHLRKTENQKRDEKDIIGRELAKLEERKFSIQKQQDEIIKHLWDEYELTRREAEKEAQLIEDSVKSQKRVNELKSKIKALGSVNVAAIEEYKEVFERYNFMLEQTSDVENSRSELYKLISELTAQMKDIFIERFNQINIHFTEIFKDLFGGGNASLNLTDKDDILQSGIEISVQPPGKIITNLESLSGGEKSLIAISLYFAIMKVRPSPFCILDEIEAALDDVNVVRYSNYLRRMCGNTQFIVITHRRGTMEEADVLYGVTMQEEGISKLLELKASEIEQKLGMKKVQ